MHITATNSNGNPFSINSYEYVCAEKLRIFEHIPQNINRVLFIDLDVFVLNNFWARHDYFKKCDRFLIITPDISVGYKEKLNDEFKQFDSNFAIKHFPNGNYYYFNTGVFFASRKKHSQFFHNVLDTWNKFFKFSGKHPSIFDQNVFNYCLNKSPIPVITMPLQNNCLRQYCVSNIDGKIYLDKKIVMAMHFNGGDRVSIKLKRWKEFEKNVHFQKHEK